MSTAKRTAQKSPAKKSPVKKKSSAPAKSAAKKSVAKKKSPLPQKAFVSPKKKAAEDEELELYPDEEQGILPDETSEEIESDMNLGKKNVDVYSEEGLEKLEEDDEIDAWEEGFAEGATGPGQLGKDALTGEPLLDIDDVVEAEIDGKTYRFVNQENAEEFRKKKEKEKEEEWEE